MTTTRNRPRTNTSLTARATPRPAQRTTALAKNQGTPGSTTGTSIKGRTTKAATRTGLIAGRVVATPGRRDADSDSTSDESSSGDHHSHHHNVRHVQDFEQKARNSSGRFCTSRFHISRFDPDHVPDTTTATPANPNVAIDHEPGTSANDLVVQGNDHVIASVSANDGFAFARSGDVIAVSGPDGARIVQASDVNVGTTGNDLAEPSHEEPSDEGGNNDVGFVS